VAPPDRAILKDAKARGEVDGDVDPYELATLVTSTLEGSLMLTRLFDDPAYKHAGRVAARARREPAQVASSTEREDEPMTTFEERSRVVTWRTRSRSWKAASGLGGIEVLRAIEGGALPPPPVARLLGFEVEQVSEGLVTFAFEPAEFHYNPLGTVHGGILTTVLDSAMGCAVHSRLRAGLSYTTLELKVNFLKPVRVTTGRVRGEGKVVHLGSRVATAEAHLRRQRGRALRPRHEHVPDLVVRHRLLRRRAA